MSRSLRGKPFPTSWSDVREILSKPLDELSFVDKFVRYFFVGGLSAVVDYAIFGVLFHFGLHYLLAATISFIFAVGFNYALSIRFVFQTGRHPKHREIVLIYLVSAVGIAINLAILAASVEWGGLHPLLGKLAGTAAVFGWNFAARHFWIFAR